MKQQNNIKKEKDNNNNQDGSSSTMTQSWTPTGVQRQLWSILLKTPYNAIATAPTSSGKTLSYALPTLLRSKNSSIVVLVPTKELVHQVSLSYRKLIKIQTRQENNNSTKHNINKVVISIHGGVPRQEQIQAIMNARSTGTPMVVVSTPGRLLDILEQHETDSDNKDSGEMIFSPGMQHWIVLDEADQLTKEGDLGPQVHEILNRLTPQQSTATSSKNESSKSAPRLVFVSATLSDKARSKFHESKQKPLYWDLRSFMTTKFI